MMRSWLDSSVPFILLALTVSLAHVEVQAHGGNGDSSPALKSTLAVNTTVPSSSQTLRQTLIPTQARSNAITSATALASTPSTDSTAKLHAASKKNATAAAHSTTAGPGKPGDPVVPVHCGALEKRSWTIRGRGTIVCLSPEALAPAPALVPGLGSSSKAGSKPQPGSSPKPQPAKASQQTNSQKTESQQSEPQQSEPQDANSQKTDPQQSESQQSESQLSEPQQSEPQQSAPNKAKPKQAEPQEANSAQTESQQTDIQHPGSPQIDTQQTGSQQTDTQPAKDASPVDLGSATPNVAPAPINTPIIVQGQIVPTSGEPIIVNNQPVIISSGYIHVGTSSIPISEAQVTPPPAQPIVAGTLTFQPASPSPVVQVAPGPFIVGGLTFFAAQSEPSTGSNTDLHQPQARPVVVGGMMYAPVEPTSVSKTSQEADQPPGQGGSYTTDTQGHPNNEAGVGNSALDEAGLEPTQADSKPIVIAGTTYTPVTTTATPSPQHPAVFSFAGTALTQGGAAVTISGTRISIGPSGVIVGTSSLPIATAVPTTSLLRIGSETLTALPGSSQEGGFEINDSTLLPGSPGISISGTLYSLNTAGSLVVGTSTIALATAVTSNGALTIGSQTLTALPGSSKGGGGGFELDHSTLLPGSPGISISGTRYSLNTAGSLIVGTSTIPLATADSGNSALTAGGETFTPLGSTAVVVDGTTLSIGGPAMTENGTKVSLASNGLLVGSSTFAYATRVENRATVSTAGGGGFSTGVWASGGATAAAIPSATGGVYRSAASGQLSRAEGMLACFGVSVFLSVMMGTV